MKRVFLAAAAALLMAGCNAVAQEKSAANPADLEIRAQLATAEALAQNGDPATVLLALAPAIRDEVYDRLSAAKQEEVATLHLAAAQSLGRTADIHLAATRLTAHAEAPEMAWALRFDSAIGVGDGADAYLAFQHFNTRHRPILQMLAGRQIDRFDRLLGELPNAREARLALGREMDREHWEPVYANNDPSLVYLHYAQALVDNGDAASAKAVAARITDPGVVMAVHADRRFDGLVSGTPNLQDPDAAARRYLQWARDYARDNPRALSGRIAVLRALAILNKPAEALSYARETVQLMAHGRRETPPFDDMNEADVFEGWKDLVLVSTGHLDEGLGGLTTLASCRCSALATVQLGRTLMEAGRPDEAKRWLSGLDESTLGIEDRMTAAEVRACVAAQLKDEAGLASELALMARHEAWKPGARVRALVCADRLDEAASIVARQIADPHSRLAALRALQTYGADPTALPYAATLRDRWAKLAAMPAVQAEVAKVGRLNHFDLQPHDSVA